MAEVIGVKFRYAGKMYYFGPAGETFVRGDQVIVETARGREMGQVTAGNREVPDEEIVQPLKDILRKATEEDIMSAHDFMDKEKDAFMRCREKIHERGLEMKLVEAEYTYDGSKVIFYFTADGRVDFRELVKDLASMFKTRIELRQIGIRDEAMIRGGYGSCGRSLCCASYLNDFVPVSIKMAKEQNLSLNPTKISGVCGRLMCCLKNEEDTYEFLNSQMPRIGETVEHKGDRVKGIVTELSVLKQKVKIKIENGDNTEISEYPVAELIFKRRGNGCPAMEDEPENPEDEAALEALEELEETEEQARAAEEDIAAPEQNKGRREQHEGHKRDRRNGRSEHRQDGNNRNSGSDEGRRDEGDGQKRQRRDRRRNQVAAAEAPADVQESSQERTEAGSDDSRRREHHNDNRNRNHHHNNHRDRQPGEAVRPQTPGSNAQDAAGAEGKSGEARHHRHRGHRGGHGTHGQAEGSSAASETNN